MATAAGRKRSKRPELIAPFAAMPWQIAPWRDRSDVILLTGSAGGGKTRLALEKAHAYLLKYPGAVGLMLRKAREFAGKSLVPAYRLRVVGDDPRVRFAKSDSMFVYQNGSFMAWGGMKDDSQREALRSFGPDGALDFVVVEEANAFTESDYNEILGRMRGRAADWSQIVLCTNPDSPEHWIYKRLIMGREARVYYSSWQDNTHNPARYGRALASMTGVLAQRLREGRWVSAEGAVYDTFSPATHVLDWFDPPDGWRRIRVIDFGYTNPFVCQWWAIDPDDRMYLYREIYQTRRTVAEHASEINRLTAGIEPGEWAEISPEDQRRIVQKNVPSCWKHLDKTEQDRRLARVEVIEASIADHDAEDRATLDAHGIPTIAAKKDVSPGIQAVKERLKLAGDGRARLFLLRGALVEEDQELGKKPNCTEAEISGYIWSRSEDGKTAKEQPVKVNDHGMDAMRYGVMFADGGPVTVYQTSDPFE